MIQPFYLLNGAIPDFLSTGFLENLKASGDVNKRAKFLSDKAVVNKVPTFSVLKSQLC